MSRNIVQRAGSFAACLLIALAFVIAVPAGAADEDALPTYYKIEGVPLYQQIDAGGCGAVSLQMVFDYYGPFIDQMEIYNAARSGGTAVPDMARAAQFSHLSANAGNRWPSVQIEGYTNRSVGYAGFYYAATEPWLDGLKQIIAQGYPVIVLVYWSPDQPGDDHYRVIVGYDDNEGVLLINDGWSRELKKDHDYQGSTSTFASPLAWDAEFGNYKMTYEDFVKTWVCPTTPWGVPDKAFGAVLVTPWEVDITVPESVKPGKTFKVTATVTYPCLAPFGAPEFPVFPARDFAATLELGEGLTVVGNAVVSPVSTLCAGSSVEVSWKVKAGASTGLYSIGVSATGLVSGSLGQWTAWVIPWDYPAYDYEDVIGGFGSAVVEVRS